MITPTKSKLFKSITRDNDIRGSIVSIVDDVVQNVSLITCNAGSIRSNHYHKKDFHYMYVLEGEIDYFYKELNNDVVRYFKVKKDDIIFTPKNEIHATFFPLRTKLIVSSKLPRDQETYENDTVRVEFINNDNLQFMINKHE
jgi:oxalate decarboxylase/phosphoglucose isomerase-like protein (cupin superfamily)